MQILAVIPARYASTRFPGKPLVDIFGKPMIQHVYERAITVLQNAVVATDDERIYNAVESFGGKVVMTNKNHQSGTDRCAEAAEIFEAENQTVIDAVINIQGDEPFIKSSQIEQIAELLRKEDVQIATLIKTIEQSEDLFNPNNVKVVIGENKQALYFSRQPIPHMRGSDENEWFKKHTYYKHIGLYGYKSDTLNKITKLKKGKLEEAESLEQLRWLENNYKITTAVTNVEGIGIDTPEDLEKALKAKDKKL